jgi:hypothetical protein
VASLPRRLVRHLALHSLGEGEKPFGEGWWQVMESSGCPVFGPMARRLNLRKSLISKIIPDNSGLFRNTRQKEKASASMT